MSSRIKMGEKLKTVPGVKRVYFRPPPNVKLEYPCIIYNREEMDTESADDRHYLIYDKWAVTAIGFKSDDDIPRWILSNFPKSRHTQSYNSDNLLHDRFRIYD